MTVEDIFKSDNIQELEMSGLQKVFVTNVVDLLSFWARFGYDEDLRADEDLESYINDHVEELRERVAEEDLHVAQNQMIIARSNEHCRWLHATSLADCFSQSSTEVDVVFPSYGSTELVAWKDIITDVPEFVLNWSRAAERFELDDVEPCGDPWSSEAVEYFTSLVNGRHLPCQRIAASNEGATDRLIIYTQDDLKETVQDCLVRRKFAKNYKENGIAFEDRSKTTAGGIPEFNTFVLFPQGSVSSPAPQESAERDFEMEEHKRHLGSFALELPTHTDDLYFGRNRQWADFNVELFDEKMNRIKEEISSASRTNRQLDRGHLTRLHHPLDVRSLSSKSSESIEDDWRMPADSRVITPSKAKSDRSVVFKPESFQEELHKHLNNNSDLSAVVSFLQPVLVGDNLNHPRLTLCLTIVVNHLLKTDGRNLLALNVLESLKAEEGFSNCLVKVIKDCHTSRLQVGKSRNGKSKMEAFPAFLAEVLLRFPDEPDVAGSVISIADKWAVFGINQNSGNEQLLEGYATCLSRLLRIVAEDAVDLVDQKLAFIVKKVKEKLFSDRSPRSVKEIFLELLLHLERRTTENRIKNEAISRTGTLKTFSISDHSSSTSLNYIDSCEGCRLSPSEDSSSLVPSHVTEQSTSLHDDEKKSADRIKGRHPQLNPANEETVGTSEVKAAQKTRSRKKNKVTVSLQDYHSMTPDSASVKDSKAPSVDSVSSAYDERFDTRISCILCGDMGGHATSDCPQHKQIFFCS